MVPGGGFEPPTRGFSSFGPSFPYLASSVGGGCILKEIRMFLRKRYPNLMGTNPERSETGYTGNPRGEACDFAFVLGCRERARLPWQFICEWRS